MLTLWICHSALLSAQSCKSVKYLDSVCGSASCAPGERTCFGTTMAMKFSFSGKVRVVPPGPSMEAGISQHPTLFWLLNVTAFTDFSAQSTSKRVESKANFPITNASGYQPRMSLCPLPHPALPTQTVLSALQDGTQPSHWSCTTSNIARQQSVGN